MRILPVSSYKTKKSKGGISGAPLNEGGVPKDGTRLRQIFDFLKQHKASPIPLKDFSVMCPSPQALGAIFRSLEDFYGLDIRSIPDCHHKTLCGEWFGDKYVDYIAGRVNASKQD